MKYILALSLIISLIFLSCGVTKTGILKSDEIDKTFGKKDNIKMVFVSGDCQVTKSSDELIHIKIISNVSPEKNYEPLITEKENSLELKEVFKGSSNGDVKWLLSVPSGIKISFKAASGNFSVENLKREIKVSVASGNININNSEGEFQISTASGNVTAKNSKGNLKLSTASGNVSVFDSEGKLNLSSASGNVSVENSNGNLKLSSASGNVTAKKVAFSDKSHFSSASGDVYVKLSATPEYDLSLSSASGSAVLDCNGNAVTGLIKLSVEKNKGEIKSSFKFNSEKEITKYDDVIYIEKSLILNSENPTITISTATGVAELKK